MHSITDDASLDYKEYDFLMKKSGDGSRTYVPENQEPLNAPSGTKRISGYCNAKKILS